MSLLAGLGMFLGANALNVRELGRQRPILRNAKRARPKLDTAFDQHLDDIEPGASLEFDLNFNKPPSGIEGWNDVRNNQMQYGGSTPPSAPPSISINPNADRAYLAHEMGHLASQQTDVGHLVATLRENPKLKKALLDAMITVPGVAAALAAGDTDMDSSIALAALATAPAIADEAMATGHGLAIMNKAGLRANLGQRGKLAGGLMSYLAAPLLAGAAGNTVGNLFDQDI